MSEPTLLFVHGTGVRSESLTETLDQIRSKMAEVKLHCQLESCEWGDVHGIDFAGLSLPDPPARTKDQEAQALRWEYLQVDPTFELRLWTTPAAGSSPGKKIIGQPPASNEFWKKTVSLYGQYYKNEVELKTLLQTNSVEKFFLPAWNAIVATKLPSTVFATAGAELPAVARVFAEAVVARMMHDAASATPPVAIPPQIAARIVTVMLFDWEQATKGVKDLLLKIFGSATKIAIRPLRNNASRAIAPAIGDILNYQSVGNKIRQLIRRKIEAIHKATHSDVFVFAHSLGGIASFELLVEARAENPPGLSCVKGLITAGSQAPLLYELGALQTLPKDTPLPTAFPPWLNLYDQNDLLSYRADRLFPGTPDKQVDSMLPPREAHSAYWKLDTAWAAIEAFIEHHSPQ